MRVRLGRVRGRLVAAPLSRGAGVLTSMVRADGLLVVPAGFTGDELPVTLSFLGPAFSEGKLLGLGYSLEQVARARRLPIHTPKLPGEAIRLP